MSYDAFLVVAVWMLSTTLLVALVADGEAMFGWPFQLFLYVELFAFYYIFWRIKGQTLGMQVWKIRVVNNDGDILNSKECLLRFAAATLSVASLGLGFLWMYFNRDRLAFHDQVSRTHVIYLGDNPYASEV